MLQFTSLTIENFGPFKGKQTIDFADARGITIIWGNNGRGKTTLLNIIRYALFGKYQDRRGSNVNLANLANIEGTKEGKFNFKVVLKMINDGVHYELTRQYTVRGGVERPTNNDDYVESVFLKRENDMLSPEDREHELNLIMPDTVSRFFLFDGELLKEYEDLLVEGDQTGASIKESIEQILGVPVLTNGAIDTEFVLEEYHKEKNRIAQSNAQTQSIATQINNLEVEKQEHTAELSRLKEELTRELDNRARLEDNAKQSEYVSSLLQDFDKADSTIEEKNKNRTTILDSIKEVTSEAWKGLVSSRVEYILDAIDDRLKDLENKENAHRVANYFMEEMKKAASEQHCHLCNQDIPEGKLFELVQRIDNASSEFGGLSELETNELQSLRIRKSTLQRMKAESKKGVLEVLEEQLATLDCEITETKRQKSNLMEELEKHGKIEDLSNAKRENTNKLVQCMTKINNYKEGIQQENEKVKELETALNKLDDKLNRVSTDLEMQIAKQKVEVCDKINQIFEGGIDLYRKKLKEEVEHDATDLFVQISNDKDYTRLQINDNYGLYMVHKSGDIVPLRSAGFEHVVALALIGALHKNAPLRGPIIMDSPFGRLDPTHKRNITKVLPKLSEQIVLLVYTDEIDEQETRSSLGSALRQEYRLERCSSFYTQIEKQRGEEI